MNNPNSNRLPDPNPVTQDRHRRQTRVQILLPVIGSAVLIGLVAVLVTMASTPTVDRFSDISIIFLIIPTAVVGLVFLAVFGALIFLLARGLKVLPSYARLVQIYLDRITEILKKAADRAADPVLAVEGVVEGVKVLFRRRSNHKVNPGE
jgi:hypothetical protein